VQETLGSLSCEERARILGLYEWFERDDTTGSVRKSYRISPNRALIAELRRDSLGRLAAPELILQAVITRGAKTDEGSLIKAVTEPWLEIVKWMLGDPTIIYQIRPRKWEEIIAGAYKKAGFDEVILTPASGDRGRDIIATKYGLGGVRVIDQVKAFKPGHLVTANDVRALMGVLHEDGASKGFVTTTSGFAARLLTDPLIAPLIPSRLELIDSVRLVQRLKDLVTSKCIT